MHHTLEIQEILVSIFEHCSPPALRLFDEKATPGRDLAALARTCRSFKEPALDALWGVLTNLSPLVRCLPEASNRLALVNMYSFTRPLTKAERDILRGYARRVRSILDIDCGLNEESLRTLADYRPVTGPLFPNLRTLHGLYETKTIPLLHLPFPSLVSLDVGFENPRLFQESLKSFPNHSPSIRRLDVRVYDRGPSPRPFCRVDPDYFCRWRNLSSLVCPQLALDKDVLVHLSHMPALAYLEFALSATSPVPDAPLFFTNLHDLKLYSESLHSISRLLTQIQLPAIMDVTASVNNSPSRQEISSFLAGIQSSGAGNTIEGLGLDHLASRLNDVPRSDALGLEDLRPCMAFSNLCRLSFDIEWNVGLTDGDVLALASACPRLQALHINREWGWNSPGGGITPGGLIRLLQTHRSLCSLALALDTRGFVEPLSSEALASLRSTLPRGLSLYALDSYIEAESVPAIASLFVGIATCTSFDFCFYTWNCELAVSPPNAREYVERWDAVTYLVKEWYPEPGGGDSNMDDDTSPE